MSTTRGRFSVNQAQSGANPSINKHKHVKFNDLILGRSFLLNNIRNFYNGPAGGITLNGIGNTGSFAINSRPPYYPALSIILCLIFSGPTPPAISDDGGNIYNLFQSNNSSNATINYYIAQQTVKKATQITLTGTSGLFCNAISSIFGIPDVSIVDINFSSPAIVVGANDLFTGNVTSTKKKNLYFGVMANFDPLINCSSVSFPLFNQILTTTGGGAAVAVGQLQSPAGTFSMEANIDLISNGTIKTMAASIIACGV